MRRKDFYSFLDTMKYKYEDDRKVSHYTYFLILSLFVIYVIQVFYLGDLVRTYMVHTSHIFEGVYYTVLTSLFFHNGIIHLLTNVFALFVFGRFVERHLGVGILFVFLGGGVLANIISNTIAHLSGDAFYSLGASSGIAALIILAILLEPFSLFTFLGWFLIFIDVQGIFQESSTNHLAHLAGYSTLAILFFFLEGTNKKKVIKGFILNIIMIILFYVIFNLILNS